MRNNFFSALAAKDFRAVNGFRADNTEITVLKCQNVILIRLGNEFRASAIRAILHAHTPTISYRPDLTRRMLL